MYQLTRSLKVSTSSIKITLGLTESQQAGAGKSADCPSVLHFQGTSWGLSLSLSLTHTHTHTHTHTQEELTPETEL